MLKKIITCCILLRKLAVLSEPFELRSLSMLDTEASPAFFKKIIKMVYFKFFLTKKYSGRIFIFCFFLVKKAYYSFLIYF